MISPAAALQPDPTAARWALTVAAGHGAESAAVAPRLAPSFSLGPTDAEQRQPLILVPHSPNHQRDLELIRRRLRICAKQSCTEPQCKWNHHGHQECPWPRQAHGSSCRWPWWSPNFTEFHWAGQDWMQRTIKIKELQNFNLAMPLRDLLQLCCHASAQPESGLVPVEVNGNIPPGFGRGI